MVSSANYRRDHGFRPVAVKTVRSPPACDRISPPPQVRGGGSGFSISEQIRRCREPVFGQYVPSRSSVRSLSDRHHSGCCSIPRCLLVFAAFAADGIKRIIMRRSAARRCLAATRRPNVSCPRTDVFRSCPLVHASCQRISFVRYRLIPSVPSEIITTESPAQFRLNTPGCDGFPTGPRYPFNRTLIYHASR